MTQYASPNLVAMPEDRTPKNDFDHVKTQASLALMLSVALVFNFILYALLPQDQHLCSMQLELIHLILIEARSARRYRPFRVDSHANVPSCDRVHC